MAELFDQVKQLLRAGGIFVFTTYPQLSQPQPARQSSELLVDYTSPEQVPLALEFYTLADNEKSWGLLSVTYSKYTYLGEQYPDQTRYFRTVRSFMKHDYLENIINTAGLKIITNQRIEHAQVFIISKE